MDIFSSCVINCSFYAILIFMVVFLLWFFVWADGDINLLFCEKFGKNPDYSGKVVWITGASSGIGEFLAYDLASIGAKLVISGVNVERLENVKRNCFNKSNKISEDDILILPFLMQDFSLHEKYVQQVLEYFGHIDVLVNNAGYSQRAEFQDIDIDVDLSLFNVNVFGTVNLTRKVLPHFFERKQGQIVVTSSAAGKLGAPFSSTYTGSKHALHGYFESLRVETIHGNISICLVCPGPVFSRITSRCATGKVGEFLNEEQKTTDKRMTTDRCSKLMVVAMANKLTECWISPQPVLTLFYFTQYIPTLFKSIILKLFFTPEIAKKLRSGK